MHLNTVLDYMDLQIQACIRGNRQISARYVSFMHAYTTIHQQTNHYIIWPTHQTCHSGSIFSTACCYNLGPSNFAHICALMHSLAVHKLNHRPTKNILSCHWSLHSPDRAKHSAATASTRHEQTWDKRNDQITWIWNQEQHEWNTRLKCPVSLVLVAGLLLLDVFIWLISNTLDGNLQQESSQGWTRWCLAYTGAYGTENSCPLAHDTWLPQ